MKKKVLFIVMSVCMLALATGCGKKGVAGDLNDKTGTDNSATEDTTDTTDTTDTSDTGSSETTIPVKEAYEVSDYITLGDYKGLEISVTKLEVSDQDVEDAVKADLEANPVEEEVTGRAVQSGDIVNIDFEGIMDGVAFENGSAEDYDLTIGSNSFIEGFEEGIIGANVGDKLSLELKFPEEYSNDPTKAGKPVTFNVTVNAIKTSKVAELTEEYVKENTDFATIEEYKNSFRENLEAQNEEEMKNEKINNVIQKLVENSTISSLPQTLVDYYTADRNYYFSQLAYYYGMDLETYVTNSNSTMDEFNDYVKTYAEGASRQELVIAAVAKAEKLEVSDEEYQDEIEYYKTNYGYETEEDILKIMSKDQIKENILLQKALDYVVEQAVVTETTAQAE
jgi:trigger factor